MAESSVWSPIIGDTLATCTDTELVAIQSQSFSGKCALYLVFFPFCDFLNSIIIHIVQMYLDKIVSFRDLCKKIGNYDQNLCIQIRRDFLLEDSMEAIMRLSKVELHNVWRFQCFGEEGVDAGGLKRLITSMLLDPVAGLWKTCCGGNQMNLQINPNSGQY